MNIIIWQLRVLLFLGSVTVFTVVSQCIRKRRMQLKDGIFWILFSLLLVLFSVFPILAVWASKLIGVQSPANCVFLILIFLLGCHQFFLTIRVSRLEMKTNQLIQRVAIYQKLEDEEKENEKEDLLLLR